MYSKLVSLKLDNYIWKIRTFLTKIFDFSDLVLLHEHMNNEHWIDKNIHYCLKFDFELENYAPNKRLCYMARCKNLMGCQLTSNLMKEYLFSCYKKEFFILSRGCLAPPILARGYPGHPLGLPLALFGSGPPPNIRPCL